MSLLEPMLNKLKADLEGTAGDAMDFFEHVIFCTNITYQDGGFKGGMRTRLVYKIGLVLIFFFSTYDPVRSDCRSYD